MIAASLDVIAISSTTEDNSRALPRAVWPRDVGDHTIPDDAPPRSMRTRRQMQPA